MKFSRISNCGPKQSLPSRFGQDQLVSVQVPVRDSGVHKGEGITERCLHLFEGSTYVTIHYISLTINHALATAIWRIVTSSNSFSSMLG